MLNAIDKQILKEVAGFEEMPKGAYNIRKNGELLGREVSANIDIRAHEEKSGIVVEIAPGTKNESVHIPVILSQAGLHDTVYNTFIIGEDADVTIIAGCGIHCGGSEPEGHSGIHEFLIRKNARVVYVEKHTAIGGGSGKRTLNPTTKVILEENATAEMELTQLEGVDEAQRKNEAIVGPGASLQITERVMTDRAQKAVSWNDVVLSGTDSRSNIVSRSVVKGNSIQNFEVNLTAQARCYGHIECDAIIMDNGTSKTVPALEALHPEAELTHEASIGKIANEQLMKLMSLGLNYDLAVNRIIQGFLR
jgi:Fe-S cluster assembly scaffold protein SufB